MRLFTYDGEWYLTLCFLLEEGLDGRRRELRRYLEEKVINHANNTKIKNVTIFVTAKHIHIYIYMRRELK